MALALGGYGCSDFVNLTPQDVITVGGYYKTESDIQGALIGTYASLRPVYNAYFQYTELPSDNTRTINPSEASSGALDKLNWVTNFAPIASGWASAYTVIAGANITLKHADEVKYTNPASKTQIIGEAKFLRALMYFNLVRFFGDVPLVLTELTTQADALALIRNPTSEVYAQIEKDLIEAQDVLPEAYTGPNLGRATSGAAKALLGKVYLQQKKWAEAETKLAEVVNSGRYQLLADINKVFGVGNDNNAEIVFACQYQSTANGEGNTFSYSFAPASGATAVSGGSNNLGTKDLNDAFETGDLRKDFLVSTGTGTQQAYYTKKFVYNVLSLNEGDNDWPVIRYADVLLMYAEALNNNGKTAQALDQVNAVRGRAGLTDKKGLTANSTQLAIEQERRVELCYEGHRWHDLIRWGKAISTMVAFKAKYTADDPANANMTPDDYRILFPVPQIETFLNPKLGQNPGY